MHSLADLPPDPLAVLAACGRRASRRGLAPPAALLGDWLGAAAVIAPSVEVTEVPAAEAFAHTGDGWNLGYRSYPDVPDGATPLLPEAVAGRAEGLLVLGTDGRWTARGVLPQVREFVAELGAEDGGEDDDEAAPSFRWAPPDRRAHRAGVLDCLEAIRAGEIYQACLSTRLDGTLDGAPLEAFLALWRRTRARRAAFLAGEWGAVLSLSPETYLTRAGRDVSSSPIKGTLPLEADPALLRASAKDVAENIMIVDLVRHDLGVTADVGSVTVPELLAVHPAPGVWHLVSRVTARTGVPHEELVETTFPPASVTGTPKLRARELIAGWEPRARGVHCGAIGLAGSEVLDLAVAIRTLEVAPDGRCEFGVGGGITIDSDPDGEWEECLHKAAFTWGGGPPPWR